VPEEIGKPLKQPSLDEIVSQSAVVIAEQMQNAAAWSKSEMDLQIEVAGILKDFARMAKINPLEGHHNVTVATGRPDSVYGSVIVEYKEPGTLSPKKDTAPNKKVIDQLKGRFYDMNREENRQWRTMFGVGTDGKYFIFLRFRDDKWTDQEPLPVNRYSTERFLWALYNLGQKGKPYQPEYLNGDFGAGSPVAQEGVRTLYEEILATDNPKAQVFFNQWKILFGEVCGYDVENLSDKLKKLAEFYVVEGKPQPAALLFAVHTYYAILIKLLAAEIVSFFNPWMPRQVEKLQSATTPAKLKRELEELEQGGIFHQMGITNFLEGDLFAWYLAVWSEPIEKLVRKMISKLDEYNPGTFSEEPAQSRDLLKKLYQQLFPKSVRHDLGEYYTPDWLAEHVLNELGYEGNPDKRLLDPACGSGTFLVMAINRIRQWYDQNREKCSYDEGELLKKILANVIGFDLNPLAVMAARTNYLVAIKDLIRHVDHVEIPVYLCDSIMTPAEYGDLFTGTGNVAKVPCSAMKPPHLLVPKEIAQSPEDVAKYADVLEQCVRNAYAPEEFLCRCRDEGLDITTTDAHRALYKELVRLDNENKNGIWARIIKNNFAPLFVGRVDYVAGNPPWIAWLNLPNDYRQGTAFLWEHYKIFPHKGLQARLGSAKDDISILFTYVCSDSFLSTGGQLGFVITQTLFKSKGGGQGFRRFQIGDDEYLQVQKVHDMVRLQPFEGATNRTAVMTLKKGVKTPLEVPYIVWSKKNGGGVQTDSSYKEVIENTARVALVARSIDPHDPRSPWLTAPKEILQAVGPIVGKSAYKARMGACFGATGVFWLNIMGKVGKDLLMVKNGGGGKKHVEATDASVESKLVYPILRGRDIGRWTYKSELGVLFPQDMDNPSKAIPISTMRRESPKAFAFLRRYESLLRSCGVLNQFFDPETDPFYSIYNVGHYTLAPAKVLWSQVSNTLEAAVVTTCLVPGTKVEKTIVPDHSLCSISFSDVGEAHYVCACLNSSVSRWIVENYIAIHPSPNILGYLPVQKYDPTKPNHRTLVLKSEECHRAAVSGEGSRVLPHEREVDTIVAKLWGVSDGALRAIQKALSERSNSKRTAKGMEAEDDN
jgi:N-6 DNA Methylase